MDPIETVAALEKRLGVPVGSLVGEDLTRAQENLADASELVRVEAEVLWTALTAPAAVKVIVLQVAKRVYLNPDGYTSESVGPYSWQTDQQTMGIYLSEDELRTLLAAKKAFLSGSGGWTGTGSVRTPATWQRRRTHNEPWQWSP